MLNIVTLEGRIVSDPETKYVNGKEGKDPVLSATYRLAVERDYKVGNDRPVDYVTCKSYGAPASFAQNYFHKGDLVIVSGRIISESNQKKGEDQKSYFTGVQVKDCYFARKKAEAAEPKDHGGNQEPANIEEKKASVPEHTDDDMPPLPDDLYQ